jgi:hypothetical protein
VINAIKKKIQNFANLNRVVREDLNEVTFEQKSEGGEGANHEDI